VKHFKAGNMAAAKKAFLSWVTPPEIKGRREKERDLFFDGKWSNNGTMTEYTRLTAKMTPAWSSAARINVAKELKAAFAKVEAPVLDAAPQPDKKPAAPTLTPTDSLPTPAPIPAAKPSPVAPVGEATASGKETIEAVQQLLRDKGYREVGNVDGDFGGRTRNTIVAFQADNGLRLTGEISDRLLADLVKAHPREVSKERATATAKDLKGAESVQQGEWLKRVGHGPQGPSAGARAASPGQPRQKRS
jgi:hypothetical protein